MKFYHILPIRMVQYFQSHVKMSSRQGNTQKLRIKVRQHCGAPHWANCCFLHNCIPENLIMAKEPQQKREEEMVPTFPKQFIITCLRYSSPYMCINTDDCLFLTCAPLIKCLLLHNILFQQICDKSWALLLALCIVLDVICESGADVYIRCPVTLCPGNYYITI